MSRRTLLLCTFSLLIVVSATLVWWGQRPPPIPTVVATIELSNTPFNMIFDSQTGTNYLSYIYTDVSIIEGTTHQQYIETNSRFGSALALDEKRNRLYVGQEVMNEIDVIENGQILTTITVTNTGFIRDVAFDPHNNWLYVITTGRRVDGVGYPPHIFILDEDLNIIRSIEGSGGFKQIVIDEISQYVYVVLSRTEFHYIWVLKGIEKIAEYSFREDPMLALDPRTGDVYALACSIHEYDLTLLRQGEIVTQVDELHSACTRKAVQVNPLTGDLYALYADSEVMVVRNDDDVLTVAGTAVVGRQPEKMAIDPLTGNVYVANYGGHDVSVIQGTETVATIEVEGFPFGIGVNPTNGWVYVSNRNSVSVLGFAER